MARVSIFLSDEMGEELKSLANELHMTPNSVGTALINDCIKACKQPTPKLPHLVKLYRRLHRKDLDWVDKMLLPLFEWLWPEDWKKEDELWKEMLGRIIESHVESGGKITPETLRELGRKARVAAKAITNDSVSKK